EAIERAVPLQRVEQQTRLLRRARSELDECGRVRTRCDLIGARLEDGAFTASGVVLGQSGDGVEQLRAAIVVEPLWRELLGVGTESGRSFGAQCSRELVGTEVHVDLEHGGPQELRSKSRSRASRTPENIQRWCG